MTHDEHVTRAMLLGMAFIPETMVYRQATASTAHRPLYLDAETMEPVTMEQVLSRIQASLPDDLLTTPIG